MKRFNPHKYYTLFHETPLYFVQPRESGYNLIVQYLINKYGAVIVREEVLINSLIELEKNVHYINKEINEARKTKGDYRFLWVQGPIHAISIFYIREKGQEALFFSDSAFINLDLIKHLSKLTGLNVYYSGPSRQVDWHSCYIDSLVFGRDVTGRNTNGDYRIPNFLSLLKQRAIKTTDTTLEVKLPDILLKTTQRPKFLEANKEETNYLIHKAETLAQFRERYSKEVMIKGKKKKISTYLVEKGYKYRDIMEIQFYLNQMQGLTAIQRERFVAEAKLLLTSPNKPEWLYEFAVKMAVEFNLLPVSNSIEIQLSRVISEQSLDNLKTFYEFIPVESRLEELTRRDADQNTAMHLACFQAEKFEYLLSSLTQEQRVEILTAKGEEDHTVLHWLTSLPHLLEFAFKSIPAMHRIRAITTPDKYGYNVLHRIESAPKSIERVLRLLPKEQILEALTTAVEGTSSALHWMYSKPESIDVVLNFLPEAERQALHAYLQKDLSKSMPPTGAGLRSAILDNMPKKPLLDTVIKPKPAIFVPALLSDENRLADLKKLVSSTTDSYNSYSNALFFSIFHRHGRTGRARANAFRTDYNNIDTYSEAVRTLFSYINDSKNGNTHPHSYRTMLLSALRKKEDVQGAMDSKLLNDVAKNFSKFSFEINSKYMG